VAACVAAVLVMFGSGACGRAPSSVAVPTFASATPTSTPALAGVVHDLSCADLLPQAQAVAVLGLPLDGLTVADVRDVPAPQVGRTRRRTCTYTAVDPVWPVKGVVLVVTVGWFVDSRSARAQHDRNVLDAAGRVAVTPERLGAATAAVVARPDSTVLLVVYQGISVDAVLVDTVGGTQGPRAAVHDVVRRVLARLRDASSVA
jgi:hypothetical protein